MYSNSLHKTCMMYRIVCIKLSYCLLSQYGSLVPSPPLFFCSLVFVQHYTERKPKNKKKTGEAWEQGYQCGISWISCLYSEYLLYNLLPRQHHCAREIWATFLGVAWVVAIFKVLYHDDIVPSIQYHLWLNPY